MSHRDDCPDRRQAERDGERDAHRYFRPRYEYSECDESNRYYERAFRSEHERIEELRAEEERHERVVEQRRAEAARAEDEAFDYEQTWDAPGSEWPPEEPEP